MPVGASQDNSYVNRLRFLRGKIAVNSYDSTSPQPLVTPGVQNPHSAYATVVDGRLAAGYKATSAGGVSLPLGPCCGCESVCPVSTTQGNTPTWAPFNTEGGSGGFFSYEELVEDVAILYGPDTPIPSPPSEYPNDFFYVVGYPSYCNSTQRNITLRDEVGDIIPSIFTDLGPSLFLDGGGLIIIYPTVGVTDLFINISLTASNLCSSETGDAQIFCFLAGSPVTLEDGSTKPIETVAVGDRVVGAFGEINSVTGTITSMLGMVPIDIINGEHKTTAPHPHITTDHKLCCTKPDILKKFAYGRNFPVTGVDGKREKRIIKGVNPERITKLQVGTMLQTLTGPREVTTLETIHMPPSTHIYHLTIDGSHSYTVDGYAVAGGATEEDFDYDAWAPKA